MMVIFVIILVVALVAARAYYSSPKQKGIRGELHIQKILSQLPESEYTIYNDVVLKTEHGTTQIDHVVVSQYGIFVIETKNYRGEIHGNDDRQEWKQIIKTHKVFLRKWWKRYTYIRNHQFYNPVLQSLGHEAQVKIALSQFGNVKVISIVVFSDQADLSGVISSHHVINSRKLLQCIQSYHYKCIQKQDLESIRSQLLDLNIRHSISDKEHNKNVKQARIHTWKKIQDGICPRCGKPLVVHEGKYRPYYGCSGYPQCRFTKQL